MMETFTIYGQNQIEHPGKYVVRRFKITAIPEPDAKPLIVADTLKAARAAILPGLFRIHRDASDDPSIIETWL